MKLAALELKEMLFEYCRKRLQSQLDGINTALKNSKDALDFETKSTAGDKHETGRAMIQLEQEKLNRQLLEIQKSISILKRIPYTELKETVESGAVIQTKSGHFFIAIGLGKADIEGEDFFVIAPSSPLALVTLGKKIGDSFPFNGNQVKIEAVF